MNKQSEKDWFDKRAGLDRKVRFLNRDAIFIQITFMI